ncbi:ABC-type Co2+ transport system, permease component [Bellilinea caldifistulae]|nr:energy-coupling factor ABC transporter permease [Bellilinea caldifistulae]GAP09143.1 ABC-type Co2+ transport system, permease component [Bellilinea caldifistulae]
MLYSPQPMHIPDGFLSLPVALALWVVSIGLIGIAIRRLEHTLSEREIPLMGILAAAIFAGQMLNFSVTGGTSGHLLGAALATILLGPYPAMLVMTAVVSVQALLFQDGGLVVMGANLFNMAIVGVWVAYAVFSLIRRLTGETRAGLLAGGFAAAWSSIFVAALACALELALSGTSPANLAVPAMGGIHALIGIGEGLITVGALAFIYAARRDLLTPAGRSQAVNRPVWLGGGLIALVLVVFSPLASSHPDGLEWVAEQLQFIETARPPAFEIIPDYLVPGISNEALATILAGVIGLVVVSLAAMSAGLARRRTRPQG